MDEKSRYPFSDIDHKLKPKLSEIIKRKQEEANRLLPLKTLFKSLNSFSSNLRKSNETIKSIYPTNESTVSRIVNNIYEERRPSGDLCPVMTSNDELSSDFSLVSQSPCKCSLTRKEMLSKSVQTSFESLIYSEKNPVTVLSTFTLPEFVSRDQWIQKNADLTQTNVEQALEETASTCLERENHQSPFNPKENDDPVSVTMSFNYEKQNLDVEVDEPQSEDIGILTQNNEDSSQTNETFSNGNLLLEDVFLKDLLENKEHITKLSQRQSLKRKFEEELPSVLAQSFIKRYKKDNMHIYKIQKRLKIEESKQYQPPEDQIIEGFENKLNACGESDISENSDNESASTASSYRTYYTTCEALSCKSQSILTASQFLIRKGIDKLSKDESLVFSRFSDVAPTNVDSTTVLKHIADIILGILEDFESGISPKIAVPVSNLRNCVFKNGRYQIFDPFRVRWLLYQKQHMRSEFNLILMVLEKIMNLMQSGTRLTKREFFYHLKYLVKSQRITDTILDRVSRMLKVGMWELNVTTHKGLVYGNLKLMMSDGVIVNCNVPGTTIPVYINDICEIHSDASFILVVEKEAVFFKLIEEELPKRLPRPFIMITGKGYPDMPTQYFLKKLWMVLGIPVFLLVDADPEGIHIMTVYKFGSRSQAHVSEHLAIPKAKWLGVLPSEIETFSMPSKELSKRQIVRAQQLLNLECVRQNELIERQLLILLQGNRSSGIEALMITDTFLSHRYFTSKFCNPEFI